MARYNNGLATTKIKRYLLHCVAKSASGPELILSEMALAKKFNVTRETAGRAVKSLVETGYIIKINGRRGMFTNPDFANGIQLCIGVTSSYSENNIFDIESILAISGFADEMYEYNCNIDFWDLHNNEPESISNEILNSGLDAMLWIAPTSEFIAPINRLIDSKFPIVVINSWYTEAETVKSNTVSYDFEIGGPVSIKTLLKYNTRNIIHCGEENARFEAWRDELIKNGIDFKKEFSIPEVSELNQRLPYLLKNYQIDAIYTNGGARRYQKVFDIVQKFNKEIDIFAIYSSTLTKIQALYPDLKIHSEKQRKTTFCNYGKQAAKILTKLLTENEEGKK